MITQEDQQVLDILARSPDGASEQTLTTEGVARDVLERLLYAGYLRRREELFARPRGTLLRFYLTSAGRKARAGT